MLLPTDCSAVPRTSGLAESDIDYSLINSSKDKLCNNTGKILLDQQ